MKRGAVGVAQRWYNLGGDLREAALWPTDRKSVGLLCISFQNKHLTTSDVVWFWRIWKLLHQKLHFSSGFILLTRQFFQGIWRFGNIQSLGPWIIYVIFRLLYPLPPYLGFLKHMHKAPKDENKELLDFASISLSPCRLFRPTNRRKVNGRAELVIGRQRVGYGISLLVATETVSAALLLLQAADGCKFRTKLQSVWWAFFFLPLVQSVADAPWLFLSSLRLRDY